MTLIENERTKLLANALDRASTACLAVGVFGPTAATLYNLGDITYPRGIILATGGFIWLSAAVTLHLLARRSLGGLQ
ncbi:hypothetical protein [Rhodospirillum rubrum]|uniref:hypothetical protein n=1 Tax=Rhodospirillum rubrum TaxID=1085 RepID=UPI00190317AD|nr:hypothetical protein [Rhodospirillum rubrum]